MSFTPGPWIVADKGDNIRAASNGIPICEMYITSENHRKHDAALIASAPELYEALKSLVMGKEQSAFDVIVETDSRNESRHAHRVAYSAKLWDIARAALAKVEDKHE